MFGSQASGSLALALASKLISSTFSSFAGSAFFVIEEFGG